MARTRRSHLSPSKYARRYQAGRRARDGQVREKSNKQQRANDRVKLEREYR